MNHPGRKFLLVVCLAVTATAQAKSSSRSAEPKTPDEWIASVRQAEEKLGERWTVFVKDLETGSIIFEHQPDRRLIPASNRKIMTFALAMEKLGPEYRFKTEMGLTRVLDREGKTINASVVLRSNGDPSLSPRFLNQQNPAALLRDWIRALANRGFTRFQGDFILDASAFGEDQDAQPEAWGNDHLNQGYAPRPSALAINQNVLTVNAQPGSDGSKGKLHLFPSMEGLDIQNDTQAVSGSVQGLDAKFAGDGVTLLVSGRLGKRVETQVVNVPLSKPLSFIRAILQDELKSQGIAVAGKIKIVTDPREAAELVITDGIESHQSPPLPELLHVMLRESDNFLAEQIWRATAYRALGRGDAASARKLEKDWLADHEMTWIEPGYDGSGLSRKDRVSASELTAVLQTLYASAYRPILLDCLPSSGISGTLRGRDMGGAPGRVVAKTGTLAGASALSGFIRDNRGRVRYVFSMIGNAPAETNGRLTGRENQIMKILMGMLDATTGPPEPAKSSDKSKDAPKRTRTKKKS